ncbi:hypothetical protein [Rhodoferax sp. GW822-FHT02A01]|uniref:hypothetical protein n=1 Tax=Rhodoferax sp. GW822-FHT02A01 TaxID=3141537 RepID=UPI00315DB335
MTTETLIKSIQFADLPALRAEFEGGEYAGIVTQKDGTNVAVIRLPGRGEDLDHSGAKAYAAERGGKLPSKVEAALLASNLELEDDWYWIDEDYDASFAWCFTSDGDTNLTHKSAEGGALAVRLIQITA